jgi:hypothetical protein
MSDCTTPVEVTVMFASKDAKTQTQAGARSSLATAVQRSPFATHRASRPEPHFDAQAGLDVLPARRSPVETTAGAGAPSPLPGPAWDFSKIRIFPADQVEEARTRAPRQVRFQAKLAIGAVDHPLEREADRVADQVMQVAGARAEISASAPRISRMCSECEEEEDKKLRAKAEGGMPAGGQAPTIVHDVLRSPGQPLDATTRAYMEPRFRQDFSRVRVHSDERASESARAIGAYAYTAGQDVVFARGQYSPSTQAGRKLLAHELTHVVQQGFRDASIYDTAEIGLVGDRHEHAADRAAESIGESSARSFSLEASRVPAGSRAVIQRQAMNCDTRKAVEDECAGATAKCQSAAGDCKSDFPKPGDLDSYIANIKANFETSDFGPNAKRNFAHWLDGSGSELEMPSAVFAAHDATKDALSDHRTKIVEGLKKRLADGRMKPNVVSDVIGYSGHANAFSSFSPPHSDDLAYSVGGFQLCSNVRAKAVPAGDTTYNVDFVEWKCQAYDCYNWDPGKGIGSNLINDTKLCCVENAGKAKHFLDHSTVWDNKDPDSTKGFSVPVAGSGSTSPSTNPSKEKDKHESSR